MTDKKKPVGLDLLREPFPAHQISKLPKPTKKQTEDVKSGKVKPILCKVCGGWHHPNVIHLDYVGHAALTDRLLDCDSNWTWEPVAFDNNGLPAIDRLGGLWIRLTVCGVTRLGYGHPDGKTDGNAIKEAIGDALRNAAMRFGAALDLWHKGDLHGIDDKDDYELEKPNQPQLAQKQQDKIPQEIINLGKQAKKNIEDCTEFDVLEQVWKQIQPDLFKIKQAYPDGYNRICKLYADKEATFLFQA